ncbi:MAG: type VI secretion system tube protein TssD [Gemmatimonadales bacterium]
MRCVGLASLVILTLVLSDPSVATAAEPVFLQLKIQGTEVHGDVALKGVEGMIECLSYEQEVATPVSTAAGTGASTGRRQYQPLKITKRIDQASPLLMKALTQSQMIEGTFRFYRIGKTGTVQQFYTVEIRQARVASIKQVNPDRLVPASATQPALEEVAFTFNTIKWSYLDGGVTFEDTWR